MAVDRLTLVQTRCMGLQSMQHNGTETVSKFVSLHQPHTYLMYVGSFSPQEAPQDIWGNNPTPQYWPVPAAAWAASRCDPYTYMKDMEMIFDITVSARLTLDYCCRLTR